MYGLESMALIEKKQQKVQVCKNTWIRRIVVVKRADERRMNELRMEVGVKVSFKKNLSRSRLKWAGHVERMGDEKGEEIRFPGSGGKEVATKTENAMGKLR